MFVVNNEEFHCPVEALANILGKKWVANIIWSLREDHKRFGELKRRMKGCSPKMLSQQLELLINSGIIDNEKEVNNNQVESIYYLTAKGKSLLPTIEQMVLWGEKHLPCK